MGVPIRDIANTNHFPFFLPMSNPIEINNISKDINIDALRGRSTVLSPNSSRKLSIHSNVLSQVYTNRMKAENKKFNWAEQIESQNFHLSYKSI